MAADFLQKRLVPSVVICQWGSMFISIYLRIFFENIKKN